MKSELVVRRGRAGLTWSLSKAVSFGCLSSVNFRSPDLVQLQSGDWLPS